jgi:hypothetical protein
MAEARLILIAAPELIPALRDRVGHDDNILTFADSEPLRALEAITSQRPHVVALERLFAASPRGAALIARIKADPGLDESEIRVLSHDTDYQRVSPRRRRPAQDPVLVVPGGTAGAPTLDRGTRRAPRFRMRDDLDVSVDDRTARLVDLSVVGAQVVSPAALRPREKVVLKLAPPGASNVEAVGLVVWARLEFSRTGSIYRAGIEFTSADADAVDLFCRANKR